MNNLVSVIMPCHNGEKFMCESINSVLRQDYQDFELLIIDDHSDDGSKSIIEKYCKEDNRVKLVLNDGQNGAAAARNLGIRLASGRYIAFLDCDDIWTMNKLSRSIAFMEKNNLVFTWSSYSIIDQYGQFVRVQNSGAQADYHSFLSKREVIGCLTAIYDSSKLGKVYAPIIRMRNDYALWDLIIKACELEGYKYKGCSENLAFFRSHPSSLTSNKIRAAYYQWLFYRDIACLNWGESFVFMIHYFKNGLIDRLINTIRS